LAALVLQGITGGFLGLAIAAISLGLVGHIGLAKRLGRNQRFASTGGVVAAGLMGIVAYFLSYRAIFFAAAALVLPLLVALCRIQPSDIHFGRASCLPDHQGPSAPPSAPRWSVWKSRKLITFAACVFLFQMANASMLPLAGEAFVYSKDGVSSLIVSALIMVPQVIVAIMAPWAGRRANTWGRRPLLLVGFAALPIRALLFAWSTNPALRPASTSSSAPTRPSACADARAGNRSRRGRDIVPTKPCARLNRSVPIVRSATISAVSTPSIVPLIPSST
jgi:predicted MFS family arabinose efflux permease